MPKTIKPGGRGSAISLRTTKELRDRLEAAAIAAGRSLAREVEYRLNHSFSTESAFGGPRATQWAYLMSSAFIMSGQASAGTADESWLDDPHAFRAAMVGVLDVLLMGRPDEDGYYVLEALKGRIAARKAWGMHR